MAVSWRVVLVLVMLLTAGAVRWWQEAGVRAGALAARVTPFPLEEIPRVLGSWEGVDADLDPRIARATGAVDRLYRRYVDRATGVALEVIVLYGPPTDLFIHAPENCYPSAGYVQTGGPITRLIGGAGASTSSLTSASGGGGESAPFRALVYSRGDGPGVERQEVYYAWRLGGRWALNLGTFKQVERVSGMYKIQIGRRVTATEQVGTDLPSGGSTSTSTSTSTVSGSSTEAANPTERFLAELVPVLLNRLNAPAAAAR